MIVLIEIIYYIYFNFTKKKLLKYAKRVILEVTKLFYINLFIRQIKCYLTKYCMRIRTYYDMANRQDK